VNKRGASKSKWHVTHQNGCKIIINKQNKSKCSVCRWSMISMNETQVDSRKQHILPNKNWNHQWKLTKPMSWLCWRQIKFWWFQPSCLFVGVYPRVLPQMVSNFRPPVPPGENDRGEKMRRNSRCLDSFWVGWSMAHFFGLKHGSLWRGGTRGTRGKFHKWWTRSGRARSLLDKKWKHW